MTKLWNALVTDESGQGLVEYALIIALVSVGLIVALGVLRDDVSELFGRVSDGINSAS